MTPKERAAMQAAWVWMDWYSSNNGTLEPVDFNETITALQEALAEQEEQEPIRFVWNGEGWVEADEYIWKTTPDAERRELYAAPQPDMNLNCKSVQKRLATSWGYVKAEQQEPVARVTGYYSGRCVIEPLNRATVLPTDMALYAAPVQQVTRADLKAAFKEGFERAADLYAPKDVQEQAEQEPIRFVWNGEGWIEADEYIWKTTDDHERRELYAEPVQEPSISDGLCGGCAKKSADGWALYCVECWEKGNGQFASNEPAANAHVSNADSDILSDVQQEPFAYEVWDENDQVLILIYASCLKEFYWIEQDDIARKLYAAPVRTKDLTDDEIVSLINSVWFLDELMVAKVNFARAVIAADREKNK